MIDVTLILVFGCFSLEASHAIFLCLPDKKPRNQQQHTKQTGINRCENFICNDRKQTVGPMYIISIFNYWLSFVADCCCCYRCGVTLK